MLDLERDVGDFLERFRDGELDGKLGKTQIEDPPAVSAEGRRQWRWDHADDLKRR